MNTDMWISIALLLFVFALTIGRDIVQAKRQLDMDRRRNK